MKTAIKIKLILCIAVFWIQAVYGAPIGTAVLLKGQMKVESQDTYQLFDEPNATQEVDESDKIHTGAGTRVKIFLREGKDTIHLYAESFLSMDKVNEQQSDLSLLIGKARFVVEPSTSKLTGVRRKFQVRASNAFIGVRGTDFVVQTDGLSTNLLTVDGVVAMANQSAPDAEVVVRKNQASKITGDEPPAPPIDVTDEAIEKIITEDSAKEWEDVEFPYSGETTESETWDEDMQYTESIEAVDEVKDQVDEATDTVQDTVRSKSVKLKIIVK